MAMENLDMEVSIHLTMPLVPINQTEQCLSLIKNLNVSFNDIHGRNILVASHDNNY